MRVTETAEFMAPMRGSSLPTQDRVLQTQTANKEVGCLAVFDGHAEHGTVLAELAREAVQQAVHVSETISEAANNTMQALGNLNTTLKNDERAQQSGAMAAAILIKDEYLHTVWIGDCEAVFYPDEGGQVPIIRPHDNGNELELLRLERRLHGTNIARTLRLAQHDPGYRAHSRAIGDHAFDFIESGEPEVGRHTLYRPGLLVLGTDGLWGTLDSSKAAVETIVRGPHPTDSLQHLASSLVLACGQVNRDDASVVLARIE